MRTTTGVSPGLMVAGILVGCSSTDAQRERLDAVATRVCQNGMNLPMEPAAKVQKSLRDFHFSLRESDVSDLLDLFAKKESERDIASLCAAGHLGPVRVRRETWRYADGEAGPDVELAIVDDWVVEYHVKAVLDRMPALWGTGTPSTHAFAGPYLLGFVVASSPPTCASEGEAAMLWVDQQWRGIVARTSAGVEIPLSAQMGSEQFGALSAWTLLVSEFKGNNGFNDVNVRPGWVSTLWCRGSWADARAAVNAGGWGIAAAVTGSEGAPTTAAVGSTPPAGGGALGAPAGGEADPELAWLVEQRRNAEVLETRFPSPVRDSIRAEFDAAPRDPVGDDTDLAALYTVFRDIDRCDPASSGYRLSDGARRVLRNVPFAQAGYTFDDEDLAGVFAREPWYQPQQAVNSAHPPSLSALDRSCIAKIRGPGEQPGALNGAGGSDADRRLSARELSPVASSVLTERSGFSNAAARLFDGDDDTAWAEGVEGPGVGEWFGAELSVEHTITGLLLGIGHAKKSKTYGDLFVLNSRPGRVLVVIGEWTKAWALDDSRGPQALRVPSVRGRSIRLTIEEVYAGERWPDTTVHELGVLVADEG